MTEAYHFLELSLQFDDVWKVVLRHAQDCWYEQQGTEAEKSIADNGEGHIQQIQPEVTDVGGTFDVTSDGVIEAAAVTELSIAAFMVNDLVADPTVVHGYDRSVGIEVSHQQVSHPVDLKHITRESVSKIQAATYRRSKMDVLNIAAAFKSSSASTSFAPFSLPIKRQICN